MKPERGKKRRLTPKERERAAKKRGSSLPAEEIIDCAWELAGPICAAHGLDLIHVEYQREPAGWVLRIYIDKPGAVPDGSVTIDDCTAVSLELGDLLDIRLGYETAYTLEVSSPGPERPISRLSDFKALAGKTARIRTRHAIYGRKNFTGELMGTLDGMVLQSLDRETIAIPHREILKARLVNKDGDDTCL